MDANARIGVLIETGDSAVAGCLPPDGFETRLGGSDEVVAFRAASWTGPDAPARIRELCRAEGLGKLVICGPSPRTGPVQDWIESQDGQPWVPVTWAAVREHCAWVEKDKEARTAKTRRLLDMAVARARGAEPCAFANIDVARSVAVAGNNHAAFGMASVLLEAGFPVILLQTGSSDGCFYPISQELVERVTSSANVQVVADASIEQVEGHIGNFRLRVGAAEKRTFFRVGAFVVAVDAEIGPLGLGNTLSDSGRALSLREYGELVAGEALDGKSVCIWLDRDGLDRRCAGQAALSFALEHARRGGKPTLLFRQVPVYGHGGQVLYDEARACGVTVVRYDTAPRFSTANGTVRVTVSDATLDEAIEWAVDRLVVPARVRPPESHARLAAFLRQPLDIQGYLQPGNVRHRPVGSARRGVYFVGGCHDECDPEEASLEAQAVLGELMSLLPGKNASQSRSGLPRSGRIETEQEFGVGIKTSQSRPGLPRPGRIEMEQEFGVGTKTSQSRPGLPRPGRIEMEQEFGVGTKTSQSRPGLPRPGTIEMEQEFGVGSKTSQSRPGLPRPGTIEMEQGLGVGIETIQVPVGKVVLDADKCAACLTCYRACPHGAIQPNTAQHRMDILDPACWQCGICAAVCPSRALEHGSLRYSQMREVLQVASQEMLGHRPIIAFACRQSAVSAADAAGQARLALPTDVLLIDVPCAGLVSDQIVLNALEQGARGVVVLGCHHDNCRSLWGSDLSRKRVDKVREGLGAVGVQSERVRFHSVAANEPHRLAHLLAEASESMPANPIGQ